MDRVTEGLGILTLMCLLLAGGYYYLKGDPWTPKIEASEQVRAFSAASR